MIIGGVAASLLGVPRLTVDIDALFLLSVKDLPQFLKDAKQEGFQPRTLDVEEFAKKKRVVLLIHEESGIGIDISMGQLPFEQEAVQRSQLVNVGGLDVRLISVEDLIITKAIAHRPQDLQDIASLLELNPKIDKKRVRKWVKEFAEILETPELSRDLEALLSDGEAQI